MTQKEISKQLNELGEIWNKIFDELMELKTAYSTLRRRVFRDTL